MTKSKLITEDHLDVMHLIHDNKNISQREIANKTGFSIGKVNYCLKALLAIGFIKVQNFNKSKKKISYAYFLTPKAIRLKLVITKKFISKKQQEFDKLNSYINK